MRSGQVPSKSLIHYNVSRDAIQSGLPTTPLRKQETETYRTAGRLVPLAPCPGHQFLRNDGTRLHCHAAEDSPPCYICLLTASMVVTTAAVYPPMFSGLTLFCFVIFASRCSVVDGGTVLQVGKSRVRLRDEVNPSSRTITLGSTQSPTLIVPGIFLRGKGRPACKTDVTPICEQTHKMWEPQRLTALWASTARYRDTFIHTHTHTYIYIYIAQSV
jgi:hypothetical protein